MTETPDDKTLVQKFLEGDEISFNKLARRYQEKIYWHARRMTGNHLDADEILQEVLMVMYKKLSTFEFKSSLYTWIYTITNSRSINLLNKNKVKSFFSLSDISGKANQEDDVIQNFELSEKVKFVDKLLNNLPVKQKEVFILRNYEELSYEEISNITGKSVGALKANYFHALNKIKEQMKKYE